MASRPALRISWSNNIDNVAQDSEQPTIAQLHSTEVSCYIKKYCSAAIPLLTFAGISFLQNFLPSQPQDILFVSTLKDLILFFFFTKVSIAICILIHGTSNSRASTGNSHISNQAIHCLPIRLPCFSKWRHQAWLGTPSYNTLPTFNVNYYPKVPAVFAKYYK